MKSIFSLLCLLYCQGLFAQYDNIWIWGSSFSLINPPTELAGLDFGHSPPRPFTFPFERIGNVMLFGESTSSISDEDGNLLFATDGYHLWNREGKVMSNGRALKPYFDTVNRGVNASTINSASQGSLIVKVPCVEHLYYVFSMTQAEMRPLGYFGDLHYSLVDMSLDNGWGDVVTGQKSILFDTGYTEHMSVVQGKGNYLWLLLLKKNELFSGELHAHKITLNGIEKEPVISPLALTIGAVGWIVGNHKADKIVITSDIGESAIMDFDKATGKITNEQEVWARGANSPYGACFSPNDSLLYITGSGLVQFEVYNNLTPHNLHGNIPSAIKEGPDGKLYFAGWEQFTTKTLNVIHYPNKIGRACEIQYDAVHLDPSVDIYIGLPNVIGVFKSEKQITTTARHDLESYNCGRPILLESTDTLVEKTTTWSTGEIGDSIGITKSGLYVAHTMSNSYCLDHIDSYFVEVFSPSIDIAIRAACPNQENGKVQIQISNIDSSYIQVITWYDSSRSQKLGIGDTLVNIKGGDYWAHIAFTTCDTFLLIEVPQLEDQVSFILDSLFCVSSEIEVENTTSSAYTSFWWYQDEVNIGVERELSLKLTDTGLTQIMLVGKQEHCYDTLVKNVQVDPRFGVTFRANPSAICVGQQIDIEADYHYSITAYQWQIGKHFFYQKESRFSIAMDEPGEAIFKLTTQFRICKDTVYTLPIIVYANPEVFLGNDSTLCYRGKSIHLQNLTTQSTNTNSYLWSTGDTTRSIEVKSPGIYSLIQKSEPIGCSGYGSVEIAKDCFVDIPNAFTPNGDGVNDYFFPRKWLSKGVEKMHLQIFNRWGQLLYETKQTEGLGWDGKWNGELQPQGVYVYRITVEFKNSEQENYEGNVTLLR